MNTKEELKAWSGFNKRDILGACGIILVLVSFLTRNILFIFIFSFSAIFFFYQSMRLYSGEKNIKISKKTEKLNKWINLITYLGCLLLLIYRIFTVLILK